MADAKAKIYTVSQLSTLIKTVLEAGLPGRLCVSGEISGWKVHSSGHCYFTLKDEGSQLPCVMWASNFKKVKFAVESGMAVLAKGHIDVYGPQGKYQFYADGLEPAGVGALQLAFEQMKKKLEAEGVFADEYKKPLPRYPVRIGIVTSETGAAVHDIADSIWNRWPIAKLFLYPVSVQGDLAKGEIAAAIGEINKHNAELEIDVLIVGRGGGSLEDLWAFNEEVVARAIFASEICVISAVGHEVDVTIADLVADARASTPTKAGVLAVPDVGEVLGDVDSMQVRLGSKMKDKLAICGGYIETILASALFRNPQSMVQNARQQIDESRMLLGGAMGEILNGCLLNLTAVENRLGGLDPKAVLNRGYSITTNKKTGKVIGEPGDVEVGDVIITEFAKKKIVESRVEKK